MGRDANVIKQESHEISAPAVWRQIVCVVVAWIAVLVSLVAVPEFLTFTLVAFGGMLLVVALTWSRYGRSAGQSPATPPARAHA